jgi:hypothetical protein
MRCLFSWVGLRIYPASTHPHIHSSPPKRAFGGSAIKYLVVGIASRSRFLSPTNKLDLLRGSADRLLGTSMKRRLVLVPMNCPYCRRQLMQIDYYGEVLVGCIDCNRWGRPGDKTLVMELLEADLEALRKARTSVKESTRIPRP